MMVLPARVLAPFKVMPPVLVASPRMNDPLMTAPFAMVRVAVSIDDNWPPVMVMAPVPSVRVLPIRRRPLVSVAPPEKVLAVDIESMPLPLLVRLPPPVIAPEPLTV